MFILLLGDIILVYSDLHTLSFSYVHGACLSVAKTSLLQAQFAFSDALQPYNASKNPYQDKLPCKYEHVWSPVDKYSTTKGVITEDPSTHNNFLILHVYSPLQWT